MDDSLNIALLVTHVLIRELLAKALFERGHRVQPIDSAVIIDNDFATVQTHCSSCAVTVVYAWGVPRGGRHLIRHLCAIDPRHRIVLIEASPTQQSIDAALRAGATAVIGSQTNSIETIEIIESAARGDSYIAAALATSSTTSIHRVAGVLSLRETEILQLVVDGFDVRSISDRLYISTKTAKHHLSSIYTKLKTSNRTDAVVTGLRLGLVELDQGPSPHYQASSTAGSAAGSGSPSGASPPSL